MKSSKISIVIFGGGPLQTSLIKECKSLDILTIVIDPNPEAIGKQDADNFITVAGQDFDKTCKVVKEFNASGLITSATDKPLVMMSKVAEKFNLPFYSIDTAIHCTDKSLMKEKFIEHDIPCAKGELITSIEQINIFPLILKPTDNSGSRGVYYCSNKKQADYFLKKAFSFTSKKTILAEEVLLGKEYSIEAIHYQDNTDIIQITEKITTKFPSNVELGHISPAQLSKKEKIEIKKVIEKIATSFSFKHCASHTEIIINDNKITVIETSPRLGGDSITSVLVPQSTGFNIEKALIHIALNKKYPQQSTKNQHTGVFFWELPVGRITRIRDFDSITNKDNVIDFQFNLKENDIVPSIENSIDRYGHFIIKEKNRSDLIQLKTQIEKELKELIDIE